MSQNTGDDSATEFPSGPAGGGTARLMVEQGCVLWESELKLFLFGVLRDRHRVDDIFQKTVVKAIEAADSARPESLRGWLFRIALNEARQLGRERRRDIIHRAKHAEQLAAEQPHRLSAVDERWLADVGLLNEEIVTAIRRSLVKLPSEQQEVIRRRIYEGQTFAEIATQMRLPLGTVLTWMRRGLMKLKEDSALRQLWDA